MTVLGLPVPVILLLFLLYSFLGVLVEGVFCLVVDRRLECRLGLLYLPSRPICGLGGAGCTLLLTPLLDHPVVVFASSVVICSAVEYVAGWAVERAFRTVSWDYSDKRAHLHGRICLQYSLAWGLLATAALYAGRSVVARAAARPAGPLERSLLAVLVVLTVVSVVLTLLAFARVRRRLDTHGGRGGSVAAVPARTSWADRLVDRVVPDRVLISSFPQMGLSAELRELARDRLGADRLVTKPEPSARVAEADVQAWRTRKAS